MMRDAVGGWLVVLAMASFLSIVTSLTSEEVQAFTDRGISMRTEGDDHVFSSNGWPDHPLGPFPSDGNPNTAQNQTHSATFPKNPQLAADSSCLPMGAVGYAVNGVPFFNPYTAEGRNAVEGEHEEEFDSCDGHPQQQGAYHYHKIPSCLHTALSEEDPTATEFILGVAFDGFAIYVRADRSTPAGLDECNGKKNDQGVYRYYATTTFPYILGCFSAPVPMENAEHVPPQMGGEGDMPPPRDGEGERQPRPEGGNGRPPPQMGSGNDRPPMGPGCVFANVSYPSGWDALWSGDLNFLQSSGESGAGSQPVCTSVLHLIIVTVAAALYTFLA